VRLYVGNFAKDITKEVLRALFELRRGAGLSRSPTQKLANHEALDPSK
jgi:hypothetical protein